MADDDGPAAKRPNSGMRGRASTRRGDKSVAAASSSAAGGADGDAGGNGADEDDGETATWKVELESIMAGTHSALVEALEPHEQKMKQIISQADRIRQLQLSNVNALFECDKKQADDEVVAQLEYFKVRLIDTIEEKQKKAAQQNGFKRDSKKPAAGEKRKAGSIKPDEPVTALPESFTLHPDELKADMEEITTNVDHYSVRGAANPTEQPAASAEAWFDRSRQLLHCNGMTLERGSTVLVYQQGQRIDDAWTLTAMNAVEVTLRDADGIKLKVTLAQLRNARYAFRAAF